MPGAGVKRRVDHAVALLSRGLAALSVETRHADWTGMYRYHLAVALIGAGARDGTEQQLDQLLTIAAATGSTRVRDDARSLSATWERRWGVTR